MRTDTAPTSRPQMEFVARPATLRHRCESSHAMTALLPLFALLCYTGSGLWLLYDLTIDKGTLAEPLVIALQTNALALWLEYAVIMVHWVRDGPNEWQGTHPRRR